VIPKKVGIRQLKETPIGRKPANFKNKSTKEAAQKSRTISSPPSLIARPLFPLGRELTMQLNV